MSAVLMTNFNRVAAIGNWKRMKEVGMGKLSENLLVYFHRISGKIYLIKTKEIYDIDSNI